jgi:hypothetical protein
LLLTLPGFSYTSAGVISYVATEMDVQFMYFLITINLFIPKQGYFEAKIESAAIIKPREQLTKTNFSEHIRQCIGLMQRIKDLLLIQSYLFKCHTWV